MCLLHCKSGVLEVDWILFIVIFVRVLGIQDKQNRDNAIYSGGMVGRSGITCKMLRSFDVHGRAVGVDVFMMYSASVSVLSLRLEAASVQSLSSSRRPESHFLRRLPKCSRSLSLL